MKRRKNSNSLKYLGIAFIFLIILTLFIHHTIKKSTTPKEEKLKISAKINSNHKDIQSLIWKLAKQLKVPEKLVKFYAGKDAIYFSFGLNKNLMGLYYANAIITTTLEQNGAKLLTGKEYKNQKGAYQHLIEFEDTKDHQKYAIRLYFGEKKYFPKKKQQLAIIVDDFGYFNGELLKKFCELDSNVTYAIIPRLKYSKLVMTEANKYHHETLIHIPMEPLSYPKNNPGKYAVYINQSHQKIKKLIESFIEELPLCVGANNHMGSLITSNEDPMKVILKTLMKHNKFFIDSHTTPSSVVKKVANELMIPCYVNYLFMDNNGYDLENLNKKFEILKKNKNEKIVVITHSGNNKRYIFLKEMIKKAKRSGYKLIPASKLYKNDLPEIL